MLKKLSLFILVSIVLTACISVGQETQTPSGAEYFVTSTLPATLPIASVTSTETATPIPTVTAPANCVNSAILLRDVTIPDGVQVKAGEQFTKTWELQNTGTCPWVNYTVKVSSGDPLNAPASIPVADTLPNEKVQVSAALTAPSADGLYTTFFTLNDSQGGVVSIGTERTFWVKFIVGVYAPTLPALRATPVQAGNCVHSPNGNYVNEIVSLINAERTKAGLSALTFNAEMAAFAQSHAEDMAYNNFLSHDGSDGSFGQRLAGYNTTHSGFGVYGEILAIGTPQDAMRQWRMDEHWDFLFYDNTQIGAGYAYNSCSDYGGYFTVDFGY